VVVKARGNSGSCVRRSRSRTNPAQAWRRPPDIGPPIGYVRKKGQGIGSAWQRKVRNDRVVNRGWAPPLVSAPFTNWGKGVGSKGRRVINDPGRFPGTGIVAGSGTAAWVVRDGTQTRQPKPSAAANCHRSGLRLLRDASPPTLSPRLPHNMQEPKANGRQIGHDKVGACEARALTEPGPRRDAADPEVRPRKFGHTMTRDHMYNTKKRWSDKPGSRAEGGKTCEAQGEDALLHGHPPEGRGEGRRPRASPVRRQETVGPQCPGVKPGRIASVKALIRWRLGAAGKNSAG